MMSEMFDFFCFTSLTFHYHVSCISVGIEKARPGRLFSGNVRASMLLRADLYFSTQKGIYLLAENCSRFVRSTQEKGI